MSKCVQCLLVAAVVGLALALPQVNQSTFSISISSADSIFEAGSEVKIRLVFKNTSDHEIPYVRGLGTGVEPRGEIFTDIEVRKLNGDLMPETRYQRLLRGKDDLGTKAATLERPAPDQPGSRAPEPRPRLTGSYVGYLLEPGESREEDLIVSNLYDLSQPGQYTITASRRLSDIATDPNSKLVAKSNTLMITVTK